MPSAPHHDAAGERILRLKNRVDTLREQQYLIRWHRDPTIPVWILVFVAVVIAIAGGVTAHSGYVINRSLTEILTQLKAVRDSGNALNKTIDALRGTLAASKSDALNAREALTRSAAEIRATLLVGYVDTYLDQLEENGELEFDGPIDKRNVSRKLKEKILPVLVNELIHSAQMTDFQARKRTEELAKRYLDIVLEQ